MFVEGTLRWQVTEDCPWDLLVALAVRDLAGLAEVARPHLPALDPAVAPALQPRGARAGRGSACSVPGGARDGPSSADDPLATQWEAWFDLVADRLRRPAAPLLHPPHFEAFDRALELQDAVIAHYAAAADWATARHAEYAEVSAATHARRAADIVDVVREREHELRRQAGYFRLDLDVLPLAGKGAWIVGPHTVVVSASLRDDSHAFRAWLRPLVTALV